jgi:hypothetical protein
MKTITSKLMFLAIAGITLVAAIAIQSCKKSSSSPAGPTVTGVSTGASDTVGSTYTLTINGANLTGGSVTTTAAGVTITNIVAASGGTSITATIAIGSTATPGPVTLTITNSAGLTTTTTITVVAIPLIGGYASSDSVASANLIAYWPFDGDANDHKGGLTATTAGSITYASTGVRGQAYQGATGAYATLVPPATFPTQLGSYTVSFWYNLPAEPTSPEGIFFYSGATQQGEIINEIEPYSPVSGDSVRIHPGFWDIGDAPNYELFVPETFDTSAIGKWVFFTVSYNGGTSTYTTYENGVPTGANEAFTSGHYLTPNPLYTDGTMTTPLGNLGFTDAPGSITIGTWPDGLFGQAAATANFLGQLDELRVFNKALTQTEVAGLFLNGKAGR